MIYKFIPAVRLIVSLLIGYFISNQVPIDPGLVLTAILSLSISVQYNFISTALYLTVSTMGGCFISLIFSYIIQILPSPLKLVLFLMLAMASLYFIITRYFFGVLWRTVFLCLLGANDINNLAVRILGVIIGAIISIVVSLVLPYNDLEEQTMKDIYVFNQSLYELHASGEEQLSPIRVNILAHRVRKFRAQLINREIDDYRLKLMNQLLDCIDNNIVNYRTISGSPDAVLSWGNCYVSKKLKISQTILCQVYDKLFGHKQ